ncbi:CRISPR-associated protein Cas2 [Streptomyces sp. XY431]|uniref:type I-E CRISPR-associated endoribonuclease Cas2e n=1 Tax=Streptomyces sp. XY431 TaxID=1415562 RepID=UPI0006AF8B35|nr:type I-E CRISPR-associated endoribonuclease Cas2e [Streptomyces sp. XY431]KOV35302.1 CRISPR-associated protein Cas2 [Streptomyces sp. XY431]
MASMIVISVTAVPDHVRGALTRWLLEVTPYLYIGTVSAKVRQELWSSVSGCIGSGAAVLAYPAANEQGFSVATAGEQRRHVVDFDGMALTATTTLNSQEMAKP